MTAWSLTDCIAASRATGNYFDRDIALREFTRRASSLPASSRQRNQCYRNALDLVVTHPGWRYCQGWVRSAGFWFAHAWAVNEAQQVADLTLRPARGVVYR